MNTELLSESPEEKLKAYTEINGVELPSGYINYVPNSHVNPTLDFMNKVPQTVDLKSTLDKKTKPPVILQAPKAKVDMSAAKMTDVEPEVKSNPIMTQALASPTVTNSPFKIPPAKAAKEAYDYYVKQHKLPPYIAAGIVGNLYHESGLDPTRKQNDGGPGRGIAQWTKGDRWDAFEKWAAKKGMDSTNVHTQLDYILVEPGWEDAIKKTMASKDVNEATLNFGKYYERPNAAAANWNHRTSVANNLFNSTM